MLKADFMKRGSGRGALVAQLEDDIQQLRGGIYDLREGDAKARPNSALVADALERDLVAKDAELRRELAILAGDGAFGSVLGKGQSMREAVGNGGTDVTLGQIIKGRGFGRWEGIPADAKALILSDGAGGAIPGAVTAGIVDIARQASVVFRGGAQLMPIAAPSAKVARMTSAPTVQWEPESAERSLDDQAFVFDAAELTAQTAWLYATISIEASEDVLDLDTAIMNHFAQQLALTFDEAGLAGTGVDQPVGLTAMGTVEDRIIEQNAVGEIAGFGPFVRAVGAVKAAHYEPSSVILTPGLWTELATLTDTTDQPLRAPAAYGALTEYVSDFLPANGGVGTDEHTAIVGDLSAMTFGVKTGSQLEISRLGDGFAKGSIALRGYIRFGWYLTRPEALCVMRGITLPVVDESGY
jgi:HK97 family phage major capsid protein